MSATIVYSTQTGRAKACARRTARILRENTALKLLGGQPFDETDFVNMASSASSRSSDHFFVFFVSTTGDGVHCDSIQTTWKSLLKKSLAPTLFQGAAFCLFCLGDRAYGPQFCAAGRKLAVRLMQLGMTTKCEVGYGDDNTPNGGVFADLDRWIQQQLLASLPTTIQEQPPKQSVAASSNTVETTDYTVSIGESRTVAGEEQWEENDFKESYQDFFAHQSPMTAYKYQDAQRVQEANESSKQNNPLLASVESNTRLTAPDWDQNTRHIRLRVAGEARAALDGPSLPYQAGDIATILPSNPPEQVERFLQTLPAATRDLADCELTLDYVKQQGNQEECSLGGAFPKWPKRCTLRGWLTYCADIHGPPEREDLRVLSQFCSPQHPMYQDQCHKLVSLSETSASALYVDYILREKRGWADVLYDFDSLRHEGSKLTVQALLLLLPPIRPRDFSIASSPSQEVLQRRRQQPDGDADGKSGFCVELCVAVVELKTPLGRHFHGLCSHYVSELVANHSRVRLWIRPGSFAGLPLDQTTPEGPTRTPQQWFESPLLCIGAGTGVAPLRGLILEREAVKQLQSQGETPEVPSQADDSLELDQYDNLLVFGCRKRAADYYYEEEWKQLTNEGRLFVLPAFSRDQARKVYVQQLIKTNGDQIMKHILEKDGAIYIAGNPSMARYSKEELIEITARLLGGDDKKANLVFKKMQARGRFSVEAWS